MDELTMVGRLLAEPPAPAPEVITAARARLDRVVSGSPERAAGETGAARRRVRVRAWWPAVAAGAVAAGVLAAQMIPAGAARHTAARRPAAVLAVKELAARAAAAAARQPAVRPGQWVFWQEQAGGPGCGSCPIRPYQVWTTANSQRAALVHQGKVVYLPPGPYDGQPMPQWPQAAAGATMGPIPVSFGDLASLPGNPQTLLRHLAGLRFPDWQWWGSPPSREFQIIDLMLASYVMPPGLTAELYRALGDIPGVTIDRHAVDVAGRHGIGFLSPPLGAGGEPGGPGAEEIILNPRTYHLMGYDDFPWGHPQMGWGIAILRQALVSGPGVRP